MDVISYTDDKEIKFSDADRNFYGKLEEKPQIEQELFLLQDQFYDPAIPDKSKIWLDMFNLCKKYSRSMIMQEIRRGKTYYHTPEELEDKAVYCALEFMQQYYYRQGYHCGASFAGVIHFKVYEVLYFKKEEEVSLNVPVYSGENQTTELQNLIEARSYISNPERIKETLDEVLALFDDLIPNEYRQFLLRCYIFIFLKKPRNKHIKQNFNLRWLSPALRVLINRTLLEIKNRWAASSFES